MADGVLIDIEGIDGAGKSVQAKRIVSKLESLGVEAVYSFEPRYEVYKKLLSELIPGEPYTPYIEALLFAADRLNHIRDVVKPALSRGAVVVLDRYYYSSIAYQGAQGVEIDWIRMLNRQAPPPHIAIYIDITPEEGMQRKKKVGGWPRFEEAELLRRVRDIYLKLVGSGELIYVDGMRSEDEVWNEIWSIVAEHPEMKRILKQSESL